MSNAEEDAGDTPAPKRKSKLLLFASIAALLAGGGGFYAVYSGLLTLPFLGGGKAAGAYGEEAAAQGEHGAENASPHQFEVGAFVHLEPLVIALGPQSRSQHLRVSLVVEVEPGREAEVEALLPRVVDILIGFLRAVDEREFELPRSMERLRAQMLRRVRLVTPVGSVRDLLIQEFLLN